MILSCGKNPKITINDRCVSSLNLYEVALKNITKIDFPKKDILSFNLKHLDTTYYEISLKDDLAPLIQNKLVERIQIYNNKSYHFLVKYYESRLGTSYSHYICFDPKKNQSIDSKKIYTKIVSRKQLDPNWYYIITKTYTGF